MVQLVGYVLVPSSLKIIGKVVGTLTATFTSVALTSNCTSALAALAEIFAPNNKATDKTAANNTFNFS